jgi:hypothetical protein
MRGGVSSWECASKVVAKNVSCLRIFLLGKVLIYQSETGQKP